MPCLCHYVLPQFVRLSPTTATQDDIHASWMSVFIENQHPLAYMSFTRTVVGKYHNNSSGDNTANVNFLRQHPTCRGLRLRPLNRLPNLWSPYVIGQTIYIFILQFLSSFFSSPNLSGRTLDVYHTQARNQGGSWGFLRTPLKPQRSYICHYLVMRSFTVQQSYRSF